MVCGRRTADRRCVSVPTLRDYGRCRALSGPLSALIFRQDITSPPIRHVQVFVTLAPYHIIHAMSEPRRPFSLTITAVGIFLLAMWNLWRASIIAQQQAMLQELEATLDPRVRLALAIVWAVVFFLLALALWRRKSAVRVVLPLTLAVYGVMHLALLFLTAPAPAARQGWLHPFLGLVLAIGWTVWVCLRPAHRDVWSTSVQRTSTMFALSPFTVKAVQRGYDGESED